ncbi:MAG: hypothetical protein ABDH59_09640, partial [Fervidobacterium sp.]
MKRCFVVGKPIYHSKSPYIFSELFEKSGIDGIYSRLNLNEFSDIFHVASQLSVDFLNVTAPFKEQAYWICSTKGCDVSQEAILSEAVNTILFDNGKISFCTNTDVSALLSIFDSVLNSFTKDKLNIAVLGAGGAARAVLSALRIITERKSFELTCAIFNRTYRKAQDLSEKFATSLLRLQAENLSMFIHKYKSFDVVVSCLTDYPDELKSLDFEKTQVFIDGNYKSPMDVKVANYLPGEVWLVKQALDSFMLLINKNAQRYMLNSSLYYSILEKITNKLWQTPKRKIVYLIGMPGSGKSTIGRLLAHVLGLNF